MDRILFTGPWVKDGGFLPRRVVLHAKTDAEGVVREYVVHDQGYMARDAGFNRDALTYNQGNYFPVRGDRGEALDEALKRFVERARNLYRDTDPWRLAHPEALAAADFAARKMCADAQIGRAT
jgi:hypothetical protein